MKKLLILLAVALLATGAFAQNKSDEPNNPKNYDNDWQAPDGVRGTPIYTEDFENGVPPAGWTVTDNAPGTFTTTWGDLAHCMESGNFTNGSGDCACVSTDRAGSGVEVDTELITPTYDLTAYTELTLVATTNYQNLAGYDYFDIDYDIGAGWVNILTWNEDHGTFRGTPGVDIALDMSGADEQNTTIRFYHYDPNSNDYDWYVQVDDFAIETEAGGDGGVPATTGIGIALMVLILGGGGAYFLRRK